MRAIAVGWANRFGPPRLGRKWTLFLLILASASLGACASQPIRPKSPAEELADRWGIEIVGLRQSAAGHVLDFRFKVLDPVKAAPLVDKRNAASLVDPATGARLQVPRPPKVGALRTTALEARPGRTYFVLFGNPGGKVQRGSRVTVEIGEFRAEGVVVE